LTRAASGIDKEPPLNTVEWLEHSLEQVVARIGDPAPQVYERLFAQSPELRAMFVGDPLGSVRGEMFQRVIETLIDVAADRPYASGMIAAEWSNHRMNGVTARQFESFFESVVRVMRQALGSDWTADIDSAWRQTLARVRDITAGCTAEA
jgi:hemoglobin-like flavoprotein